MNILILGASGFIGKDIKHTLEHEYAHVYGTYHTENDTCVRDESMLYLDVNNEASVEQVLTDANPDIIISSLRGDFAAQAKLHERMAEYLSHKNYGRLIYLSSLNVFDAEGTSYQAHSENDQTKSDSDYGSHKIECEKIVKDILGDNGIIIRLPFVWGDHCRRLHELEHATEENKIKVYKNLTVSIATDEQIADWITYIIKENLTGTFHVTTADLIDYYELYMKLADKLGLSTSTFDVEKLDTKRYQALCSSRDDIPEELHLSINTIIDDIQHHHMHDHNVPHVHANKKAVVNRLSKAIGHLESIRKMVDSDRDCSEVLIQLSAVKSALNNTGKVILKDHLDHCVVDAIEHHDMEKIEQFSKAIELFIK